MAACSKQLTPTILTPETTETITAATAPITVTTSPLATEVPTSTPTLSPTPTSLPADTYPLNIEPWPESGDLLLPIDVEVVFETRLEDLEPGDYLVVLDSREHVVRYASLSTGQTGDLLRISQEVPLPRLFAWYQSRFILAEPGEHWRVYDLVDQRAWCIGPVCASTYASSLSPGGNWLRVECSALEKGEASRYQVVLEVIALESGKGFDIVIPNHDYLNISWLDDDSFMASEVRVNEKPRNCGLHFLEGTMYCPPSIASEFHISLRRVTRLSIYISMTDYDMSPWQGVLVPKACFENFWGCSDIVDLGPIDGSLFLSPEGNVLAWIGYIYDPELTNIGVFEPPDWESRKIAQFKGDYFLVTWCPDESCMIVSKRGSTYANYRINLDGAYFHLPFEEVIGSFSIP